MCHHCPATVGFNIHFHPSTSISPGDQLLTLQREASTPTSPQAPPQPASADSTVPAMGSSPWLCVSGVITSLKDQTPEMYLRMSPGPTWSLGLPPLASAYSLLLGKISSTPGRPILFLFCRTSSHGFNPSSTLTGAGCLANTTTSSETRRSLQTQSRGAVLVPVGSSEGQ